MFYGDPTLSVCAEKSRETTVIFLNDDAIMSPQIWNNLKLSLKSVCNMSVYDGANITHQYGALLNILCSILVKHILGTSKTKPHN